MTELRKQLLASQAETNRIKTQYLNTHTNYIFITDHAIIRYLERVEDVGTYALKGSEAQRVTQYIKLSGSSGTHLRNKILSQQEQHEIVLNDIHDYHKDGHIYVIRNLALVTITKIRPILS